MTTQSSADRLEQIVFGFAGSKILFTAIELGLFTELANGPLDAAAIQARLKLHPRAVRDFLDALVALGLLERNGQSYANTPETEFYLDRTKPTYIGNFLELQATREYVLFGSLREALTTGKPQNELKQGEGDWVEALYATPERLRWFLRAMTGHSLPSALAIARQFPWSKYRTFADIGPAEGCLPVRVALANSHLHGEGFDLPQVRAPFEDYVASFGLGERLKFRAGDFFKDPLPSADVLVMGMILHDWDLETKRMLLRKAYDALPNDGALIVYEHMIDNDRRKNITGLVMSLIMLLETQGGFDYTGPDCEGWMRDAGFKQTSVEQLTGIESMVVGIK
jgi:O-methyltransferase domain/Dimerisation domain